MIKITKRKLLIVAIIITTVTVIFSLFPPKNDTTIKIVSSNPKQGETKVAPTAKIYLVLNHNIDTNLIRTTSTPTENWTVKMGNNDKEIVVSSKEYLNPDTQYSLEISYDNQTIDTLSFKTVPQQGDPKYTQQVQLETQRDFPLSIEFPYETNLYRASYTAPLTITIRLKTTTLSQVQATAQVKSYINNKGGDAGAHKYVVVPASPTPTPSIAPATTQPDL